MLKRKGRRLGRDTGERNALFRGLLASLIKHERVETTEAKARETKKVADHLISLAVSAPAASEKEMTQRVRRVNALRRVRRVLTDKEAVKKLFTAVAPRYRPGRGGYTRIIKHRVRRGDASPMALLELLKE